MFLSSFFLKVGTVSSPHIHFYSQKIVRSIFHFNVRNAGHSHWQNVQANKLSNDKIKLDNTKIVLSLVQRAIKSGNGIRDPKLNGQLATALERAKSLNIPMSSLEKTLSGVDSIDPYIIEFKALGGLCLLVETCHKSPIHEKNLLVGVVKKYGFQLSKPSMWEQLFKHEGMVICNADETLLTSEETSLELGIDLDATEVHIDIDPDTKQITYKFHCCPRELNRITASLSGKGAQVIGSYETYVALKPKPITSETAVLIKEMSERIFKAHDQVQRLFDNTVTVDEET